MSEDHHRLALPQGTRIRDFEFHRVLGHGGFGITYLGWNITLDIPVAIKEYLPADLATRESDMSVVPQSSQVVSDFRWGLERFLDEARTLARLQHLNIVRVHQYFEAHGTAYIAMDYVEGEDLSAYLTSKETLREDELKAILYPLLDALEVVHGADFLHRDIKPGNIVLRAEDGSPVLLDFGAARQAIGAKSRSVTSIVTPGYAPIEQYSSRGRQGPWTDIYALGGVCYRALTGQVPDDATDRVRNDPLIPVAQRCVGQASQEFLAAIDAALSVDEGDRPQSVGAWQAVLGAGSALVQERRQTEVPRLRDTDTRSKPPAAQRSPVPERADLTEERDKFVAEMKRDPSPDAVDDEGMTDLHGVSMLNLPTLTVYLLNHGVDVNTKDNNGLTPLHYAASGNAPDTAEVLLSHGADVHAKVNDGRTPLHAAAFNDASDTAEVLLSHGANVHEKDNNGLMPLHIAAWQNASDAVSVLLSNGADIHVRENEGLTPLHIAASENASDAVSVLLSNGADIHARAIAGLMPLHTAASGNASDAVFVLLNNGADIHAKTNDGLTPLHVGARKNASDAVSMLLKSGADIHVRANDSLTPLHYAAVENAPDAVSVLLENGADIHVRANDGLTPLHVASEGNAPDAVSVLLKSGADIHARANEGLTPLHAAAWRNADKTAEVLLIHGADIHAEDDAGLTPLHIAEEYTHSHKTAEVLRRYGARENESSSKDDVGCSTALVGMGAMGFVLFFFISLLGC